MAVIPFDHLIDSSAESGNGRTTLIVSAEKGVARIPLQWGTN